MTGSMTRRARRLRRPADRRRDARPGAGRRRRRPRPAAGLPRHGARRRQDVQDARGGASAGRRAGPISSSASSRPTAASTQRPCSTASRSCPAAGSSTAASSSRRWTPTRSIARQPTVALVDELAHTNVPGSAREKRWQDVEVIRDAGHPCHQHLQRPASRVGRRRRRRRSPARRSTSACPTRSWPLADEVELVDMSPHALRQRMRHGNVYPPERTEVALDRFFTEPNLTALREIALRFVARQVDEELAEIGPSAGVARPAVTDRVAVAVDETRSSRLRAPSRGCPGQRAPRATPGHRRRDAGRASAARSTGNATCARTSTTPRTSAPRSSGSRPSQPADGLIDVLRRRRATHLLVAHRETRAVAGFRRPSVADEVLRELPTVEVHLVAADPRRADRHPDRRRLGRSSAGSWTRLDQPAGGFSSTTWKKSLVRSHVG